MTVLVAVETVRHRLARQQRCADLDGTVFEVQKRQVGRAKDMTRMHCLVVRKVSHCFRETQLQVKCAIVARR